VSTIFEKIGAQQTALSPSAKMQNAKRMMRCDPLPTEQ